MVRYSGRGGSVHATSRSDGVYLFEIHDGINIGSGDIGESGVEWKRRGSVRSKVANCGKITCDVSSSLRSKRKAFRNAEQSTNLRRIVFSFTIPAPKLFLLMRA